MIRTFRALTAVSCLAAMLSAHATTVFDDESNFLAAIGGSADATADFNGFAADTTFLGSTVDVGPFSLSATGTVENKIDAPANTFGFLLDNTTYAHLFVTPDGTTARIDFDAPVIAFGALTANMNPATQWALTTSAGSEVISGNGVSSTVFFGFVLDAGVTMTSILVSTPTAANGGVPDAFGIDNVLLALDQGAPGPTPAPEPPLVALLAVGLVGVGLRRRRTR